MSRESWSTLPVSGMPFFSMAFEDTLTDTFPYLQVAYHVYRESFAIRTARIQERITSVPFSDLGDVVSLQGKALPLETFRRDALATWGDGMGLTVHTGVCPVGQVTALPAALVDYAVALGPEDEMLRSCRKTLRHILRAPLESGTLERTNALEDLEPVYDLYVKHIREVANLAAPKKIFAWMLRSGEYDVWVWKHEGRTEAFAIFAAAGAGAHYAFSAATRRAKALHVPHHLIWESLKTYAKEGKERVFLGPTRTGSNLSVFKEGFRGVVHPIVTVHEGISHKYARTSPLRALWRFVPLSLVPGLSKLAGKYLF